MLHEQAIFELFKMTPDLVCIVSRDGYFQQINPAVPATLGYSHAELMRLRVAHFIHPADRERTAANRAKLLNNEPLLNFQNRYLTKSGDTVWLEWTSVYLPEKELVFAIAKNITAGKKAELALTENLHRLHQLTTQVKKHTEKERQRIAGALHEDLGQLAAVVKTKMERLSMQPSELSPQNNALLAEAMGTTTQLLNKLQRISYSLGPGHLAMIGLHNALEWMCRELSQQAGIACTYKGRFRENLLTEEEKLDLYRICQEALQNVAQHAAATTVAIFLRTTKQGLLLTITDNGLGFNPADAKLSGISVMKARALSINGTLSIRSGESGTTVHLLLQTNAVVNLKV